MKMLRKPQKSRTEITFELEVWPGKRFKKGPRESNTGLGTYRSLHDVEEAVKRIKKGPTRGGGAPEFRLYMVVTDRTRIA